MGVEQVCVMSISFNEVLCSREYVIMTSSFPVSFSSSRTSDRCLPSIPTLGVLFFFIFYISVSGERNFLDMALTTFFLVYQHSFSQIWEYCFLSQISDAQEILRNASQLLSAGCRSNLFL